MEAEFQASARNLEEALKRTVKETVPKTRPNPHNKRWWTKDLTRMHNELKMLSKASHMFRALPDHPSHRLHKEKAVAYDKAIKATKKEHWLNWLEDTAGNDLWTAHKYISNPAGDGGKTRIPTLRTKDSEGNDTLATTNKDKSKVFARSLFPSPPMHLSVPQGFIYPEPTDNWTPITEETLSKSITKLSPYKAPGPDGIANIVFQHCPHLQQYLLSLFNAVFML